MTRSEAVNLIFDTYSTYANDRCISSKEREDAHSELIHILRVLGVSEDEIPQRKF